MLLCSQTLVCPVEDPELDFSVAYETIKARPGIIIVEMDPWTEKIGSIYLADSSAEDMRPTSGTVLSVGEGHPRFDQDEIKQGDRVILARNKGRWIAGANLGRYKCRGQLRHFGCLAMAPHMRTRVSPLEGIIGKLTEGGFQAVHDKIYVKRDECQSKSTGGILLTDDVSSYGGMATVISAGAKTGLKPGQRILYDRRGTLTYIEFMAERYGLPGDPSDYVCMDASAADGTVLAVVEDAVAA